MLGSEIAVELGKHTQYFEPFCGSMAVLLAKEPSQKETANDLHGDLIVLARVVAHPDSAERLYDRLSRAVMSVGALDEAREILSDESLLETVEDECREYPGAVTPCMMERAYWYFLASWMGRNGTAGTARLDYQIAVRWTKNGGSPTMRFRNAVESIPAWHHRLRNVVIIRKDALSIIPRFEDVKETAIYCDPPYAAETRANMGGKGGGGGRYKHEFKHGGDGLFFGDDHARLASVLREFKHARIVVSAYDCPRYRELYAGWTFIEKTMAKLLHAQNGRGARRQEAPEILIVNGPSIGGTVA